jgi:hypothetical protein
MLAIVTKLLYKVGGWRRRRRVLNIVVAIKVAEAKSKEKVEETLRK